MRLERIGTHLELATREETSFKSSSSIPYNFRDCHEICYTEAYALQKELFRRSIDQKSRGERPLNTLLFCEHEPVFTLGKHGKESNLLISEEILRSRGVNLHHIDRGGDITYHGPGQITGYPIFDLEQFGMGIKQYIYTLEECIIDTLRVNGIQGERLDGATGVWIEPHTPRARKICAIGVHSSRYVTLHGFALNVFTDLSYFSWINPCGFTNKGVTSMAQEMDKPTTLDLVKQQLEEAFHRHFYQAYKRRSSIQKGLF
ncbi:MAG: lipoyl(octanoyl) transferase LipB [Porphyromonas sp.]|nr:lipoyl(octanoyl) transferase LipB [Porphyromonas sp.]